MATLVSTQGVQYNFDQQGDSLRFKTYKWTDISGSLEIESLLAKDIQQAFDEALAKRGLASVEGDTADLHLRFQVPANREKELTTSGWTYGRGWRRGACMGAASTTTTLVGSAAVDMYEVSNRQLVWRGAVTRTTDPNALRLGGRTWRRTRGSAFASS